jgi:hypothetical protein
LQAAPGEVIETKLTGNCWCGRCVTCLVVMNNIVSNSGDGSGNHCKIENNVIEVNSVGIAGLGT